jgi:hypothetical protein
MWEQTNVAHAQAVKERAAYGELLEEDLGHDDQDKLRFAALELDAEGVAPEANPHLMLSPGEVEMGLTPQQKLQDLKDQYNAKKYGKRNAIFEEASDRIADERKERPADQEPGIMSARAGGSDDRSDAPHPGDTLTRGSVSEDPDLPENGGDEEETQPSPVIGG